jgi:tight adherence protein B
MASSFFALFLLLALGLVALRASQVSRLRRVSLHRIGLQVEEDNLLSPAILAAPQQSVRTYPRRYQFAAPVAGLLMAGIVFWGTGLPVPYSIGSGTLIAALTYLLEIHWADVRIERVESQLVNAIDLMVASLRAGSALLAALEATLHEAGQPLRQELEIMVGRIRLGEDPRTAVKELAARIPLESFRLFSHSLLVHWETGGSLTSSLRTVGTTVRDRLEVSRRISAQAIEAQLSVVAVMAIAYGLVVFMLKSNPGPMRRLLYSEIGAYVAGSIMLLQTIGTLWIWRMSRIRF